MKASTNVVLITTDTQGRNMVSAYGKRAGVETPSIDRFADDGVLFENAFCASPVCTPARSAWYSGLHPNRNGAWTNNVSMLRSVPLLAEVLGRAGYRSVHLGKWHLDGGPYDGHGRAEGGFEAPWFDLANFHQANPQEGPNRFRAWNRGLEDINSCFAHQVADRAIAVMREARERPLFLAVEFDEPHGPYICPPPFRGRFDYREIYRPATMNADMTGKPAIQRNYAAYLRAGRERPDELPAYYRLYHDCNSYVDHEIGRLLDAIRRFLPENTMVIYTADHGDHHGAFGLCAKGPTVYDSTCAVPLIIQAPGAGRGRRIPGLASGVDIFPTILDFAGIDRAGFTPRHGYTGQSLLPVLCGERESVRDHVIVEYNRFGISHMQDDGFFPIRCIRTRHWKLAINLFDRDEMYDLVNDPEEQHNCIDDPVRAEVRNDLHDRLLAWQETTHDPFASPQWKLRPWRKDVRYAFEGLNTTGYKDIWENHDFHGIQLHQKHRITGR